MIHKLRQDVAVNRQRTNTYASQKRREETRTKIELGGLVHKSQLSAILDIDLGDNLHGNPQNWEKEALILGALIDAREKLLHDENEDFRRHIKRLGELSLKYDAMKI